MCALRCVRNNCSTAAAVLPCKMNGGAFPVSMWHAKLFVIVKLATDRSITVRTGNAVVAAVACIWPVLHTCYLGLAQSALLLVHSTLSLLHRASERGLCTCSMDWTQRRCHERQDPAGNDCFSDVRKTTHEARACCMTYISFIPCGYNDRSERSKQVPVIFTRFN